MEMLYYVTKIFTCHFSDAYNFLAVFLCVEGAVTRWAWYDSNKHVLYV